MTGKLLALLPAAALAAAAPARASLGGTAASVEADRKALGAVRRGTVAKAGYTVQEFESGGVRVREYVSAAGEVFGIAWNGLTHPDLATLLGSRAAAWQAADERTPRVPGRRHRTVVAENVVVEKWGHMRNLQGRAYDPALLPPGVKPDDIR